MFCFFLTFFNMATIKCKFPYVVHMYVSHYIAIEQQQSKAFINVLDSLVY